MRGFCSLDAGSSWNWQTCFVKSAHARDFIVRVSDVGSIEGLLDFEDCVDAFRRNDLGTDVPCARDSPRHEHVTLGDESINGERRLKYRVHSRRHKSFGLAATLL